MTKKELVNNVYERMEGELSKRQINDMLDSTFSVLSSCLIDGDSFSLPHFGRFHVKEYAARQGYNPSTGEKMTIPAQKRVKFKPAKTLKETVA